MQFTYDGKLPVLLSEIEHFLVWKTPQTVAKLDINEPAYAVFLWYSDSSVADGFAPEFGVGTQSMRLACAKKYDNRSSVNDCIWRPQQVIPDMMPRGRFRDRQFIAKCNDAYAMMLAANTSGLPLEDEGNLLRPFRSMMHRVALGLSGYEWQAILKPTDDFAVVSLDSIGYWLKEDLEGSMPMATFHLLQHRGLLLESKG